jgi:hypothetical protein
VTTETQNLAVCGFLRSLNIVLKSAPMYGMGHPRTNSLLKRFLETSSGRALGKEEGKTGTRREIDRAHMALGNERSLLEPCSQVSQTRVKRL